MVAWDYYKKFDKVMDSFLPSSGEGETKATQVVTAVNKLIYKWYNDGDVYDNTRALKGWCNDLSDFANWLYKNTDQKALLVGIWQCTCEDDYENLLQNLADNLLDMNKLLWQNDEAKIGSIYDCDGLFSCDFDEDEWELEEEEVWE